MNIKLGALAQEGFGTVTRAIFSFSLLTIIGFSLLGFSVLSTGCKGDKKVERTNYTVRGEIKNIPSDKTKEMTIHHEKVIGFVSQRGKKSDMPSMSMRFGVAKGLDISTLKVGDKMEFSFGVSWTAKPSMELSTFTILAPDTALALDGM